MALLPRVKRIPFVEDTFNNIVLTEEEIQARCFLANGDKKEPKKTFIGTFLSHMHLSFLCDFGRFVSLHICDLSHNFISDILPLSSCMNLIWLDIHNNHIEELPDDYFWTGMVSLKILNAHDNPISSLVNIKYLSACPRLELLTLYDTPVAVHPFYRHCCVNKIGSLKALDHHLISDDEVIEGFLCPPKFTKFADGLKVKLRPRINEGIAGVYAVLHQVSFVQSKMSPCLFVQRMYRGYRCRKQLKKALKSTRKRRKNRENSIFNLTALTNMAERIAKADAQQEEQRPEATDANKLPPIPLPKEPIKTTAQQTESLRPPERPERAQIVTTVPTASTLRLILHKLTHSNTFTELEGAMDNIRARRMDGKTDQYVREVAETAFEDVRKEIEMAKKHAAAMKEKDLSEDGFFLTKSYSSDGSFEIPNYRVRTGNYLRMVRTGGEPFILSPAEVKQIEAQLVKQADEEYHKQHKVDIERELSDKLDSKEMRPVNMNAVRDKVIEEENLTQQLACLAAVEKAYHERKVREKKIERATTVEISREASMQAVRKKSDMVISANDLIGHEMRTQRHFAHVMLSKMEEASRLEKRANHRKRMEERLKHHSKLDNYRAVCDLRQRFCAISASINKYDWANRQHAMVERSRAFVEQAQHMKQAAGILISEGIKKHVNEVTAANQLEMRRVHEAIDAANEVDLSTAKKRVLRVKHERPGRYPPQLPGAGSMALDGLAHATYNPVIGTLQRVEEGRESLVAEPPATRSHMPYQEIVDIRERWKVLAGVPHGRIGLHPITADIS